ncbi:MAG: class I SAM-dependent methyltransferase, partial [Candidatus Pacebacteria bacterium]|nr:class I SAM-dependent methyltransferase [Candidatus Paceibacterota bacterium]
LREIHTTGEGTLSAVGDDSLDAALVFDVLQHVKDWEELFGNIVRCLHPGGRLLINPSVLSHPGKVDADNLRSVLSRHNIRITSRRACRLMHYKHFTEDEIWVCETCTSRDDDAGG